jgi:hypothetical protein
VTITVRLADGTVAASPEWTSYKIQDDGSLHMFVRDKHDMSIAAGEWDAVSNSFRGSKTE